MVGNGIRKLEQATQLVLELSPDMHGGQKGMAAGVVGQYMHIVDVPEFEITPVFQGKGFASRCELTASFRIFRTIKTAVKLLVFMRRQRSGTTEKSVQA